MYDFGHKATAPQIVGRNIASRRRSLGLTQEELGNQLNYSRRQIVQIEHGRKSLPVELLPAIGQILKLKDPISLTQEGVFEEWV